MNKKTKTSKHKPERAKSAKSRTETEILPLRPKHDYSTSDAAKIGQYLIWTQEFSNSPNANLRNLVQDCSIAAALTKTKKNDPGRAFSESTPINRITIFHFSNLLLDWSRNKIYQAPATNDTDPIQHLNKLSENNFSSWFEFLWSKFLFFYGGKPGALEEPRLTIGIHDLGPIFGPVYQSVYSKLTTDAAKKGKTAKFTEREMLDFKIQTVKKTTARIKERLRVAFREILKHWKEIESLQKFTSALSDSNEIQDQVLSQKK